jgi:ATP-binding cassette subfamily B protein
VAGLLVAAIPATVAELRFSGQAFRLRNWRSPDARRLIYLEYVLANDEHAKEVKLFGLGPLLLGRYQTLAETFYREDRALAMKRARMELRAVARRHRGLLRMLRVDGVAAAGGFLTLGEMTLYMVAFRQGQQAFQSMLASLGGMYEDNLYMSNLFAFFDGTLAEKGALADGAAPELAASTKDATSAKTADARPAVDPGAAHEMNGFPSVDQRGEQGIRLSGSAFGIPARTSGRCATSTSSSRADRAWPGRSKRRR